MKPPLRSYGGALQHYMPDDTIAAVEPADRGARRQACTAVLSMLLLVASLTEIAP